MISITAKIGTPIGEESSLGKKTAIVELLQRYKAQGKIIGDFILVTDTIIEIRFTDTASGEAFVSEAKAIYELYQDTLDILNIQVLQ
jgi:hypothetical protein